MIYVHIYFLLNVLTLLYATHVWNKSKQPITPRTIIGTLLIGFVGVMLLWIFSPIIVKFATTKETD
jgi:drug/metabolite transporter (DMT)-like permease